MKNICLAHLKIYEIVVRLTFYSCSITFLHNDCAIIYILYTYIYIYSTRGTSSVRKARIIYFSREFIRIYLSPLHFERE